MKNKSENAYKTIGEVVKIIGLQSKKGQSIPTHTIRYWEKEFKQIKPKILNGNRRYYDEKNITLLKKVHFLLKEQGMTINGVKKILNNKETLRKNNYLLCGGSFFSIKTSCFLVAGLYFFAFNLTLAFSPPAGFLT